MHFNDNYRLWDDDMIVGSVHTIEYLELLYWLDRIGYDGYLSMDQYPYREEPRKRSPRACSGCRPCAPSSTAWDMIGSQRSFAAATRFSRSASSATQ